MIQEVGSIELFELLETEPKTQCTACLSHWNGGIVYCTCGHFLQKETEANRHFVKCTMELLSLPEYVIKKGRPHGHRYGKNQETKNIIWRTNWRRNAKRKSSKESMTDSYEIMNFVSEWLNIIEMKKFVDDGMFLQMKITLVTCQKKNTSTTRINGGSIPISRVLTPYHWENVLISSKRCLPWNVYRSWRGTIRAHLFLQAQTMAVGIEFVLYMVEMARFLVVFLKFRMSRKRQAKSWEWTERSVFDITLAKTSEDGFQKFKLFCYR